MSFSKVKTVHNVSDISSQSNKSRCTVNDFLSFSDATQKRHAHKVGFEPVDETKQTKKPTSKSSNGIVKSLARFNACMNEQQVVAAAAASFLSEQASKQAK